MFVFFLNNLFCKKNTRLYILECKIGRLICKTLISNVYCGADGTNHLKFNI